MPVLQETLVISNHVEFSWSSDAVKYLCKVKVSHLSVKLYKSSTQIKK